MRSDMQPTKILESLTEEARSRLSALDVVLDVQLAELPIDELDLPAEDVERIRAGLADMPPTTPHPSSGELAALCGIPTHEVDVPSGDTGNGEEPERPEPTEDFLGDKEER